MPPYYSLIIVVDNDAATIRDTLSSILAQDFTYYEAIIIDDASTDGSDEICRRMIEGKKNFRLMRMKRRVGRGALWNLGADMAVGEYVMFLSGTDLLVSSAMTDSQFEIENSRVDLFCSFGYLTEKPNGNRPGGGKLADMHIDEPFRQVKGIREVSYAAEQWTKILATKQINNLLGTKFFRRNGLIENYIRFDEQLEWGTELLFVLDCFLRLERVRFTSKVFYFVPSARRSSSAYNWRDDFDRFRAELERRLNSIPLGNDEALCELQFIKSYWSSV